ncbi:ABC transporter ATP-binding protein [Escherichia coli]|uniref:ABC transporter ATP-binding protein n=1 Tax=Escherichia coli TaxID=562 RepID=A0A377KEG3_ECOLX|nr:ABC transporter ATP-binding protein [Escherichia coli]
MTIVEINHLQVTFAEKTAVSAASFSVNAGETFSLIGESGCGKSTILRVIAGLQRDWHGQVSLFGHTIKPGMRFQGRSPPQCANGVSGSLCLVASQSYSVANAG